MAYIKLKDGSKIIETLISLKKPHVLFQTKNTKYLFYDDVKYLFSETILSMKDLNFIKKVKKEVILRGIKMFGNDLACDLDVSYFDFQDVIKERTKYVEIDINGAYWECAYKLEYISESTYNLGLTYPKKTRLVALGSLAVRKMCYEYDGYKYTLNEERTVYNPVHASYFKHISFEIGLLMSQLFLKNNVLFYWVDAFFVPVKYAENLKQDILNNGYDFKEIPIQKIEHLERQGHDEYIVYNEKGHKPFIKSRKLDRSKEKHKKVSFEW
jgi:hypothetical protein